MEWFEYPDHNVTVKDKTYPALKCTVPEGYLELFPKEHWVGGFLRYARYPIVLVLDNQKYIHKKGTVSPIIAVRLCEEFYAKYKDGWRPRNTRLNWEPDMTTGEVMAHISCEEAGVTVNLAVWMDGGTYHWGFAVESDCEENHKTELSAKLEVERRVIDYYLKGDSDYYDEEWEIK